MKGLPVLGKVKRLKKPLVANVAAEGPLAASSVHCYGQVLREKCTNYVATLPKPSYALCHDSAMLTPRELLPQRKQGTSSNHLLLLF